MRATVAQIDTRSRRAVSRVLPLPFFVFAIGQIPSGSPRPRTRTPRPEPAAGGTLGARRGMLGWRSAACPQPGLRANLEVELDRPRLQELDLRVGIQNEDFIIGTQGSGKLEPCLRIVVAGRSRQAKIKIGRAPFHGAQSELLDGYGVASDRLAYRRVRLAQ